MSESTSQTKPNTSMSTSLGTHLSLQIVTISEIDLDGNEVTALNLDADWDNGTATEHPGNTTYYYYSSIGTNASIDAHLIVFKQDAVIEFAGANISYATGSLKIQFGVYGWPFISSTNTLQLTIKTNTSASGQTFNECHTLKQSVEAGYDSFDSLDYLMQTIGTVTYYGRFYDRVLSDGRPVYSPVKLLNNTDSLAFLTVDLPHCESCVLDPDFSILIKQDQQPSDACSSGGDDSDKSRSWVIPVAVVVPCVVVAGSIIAFALAKKKFYFSRSGNTFRFVSRGKSQRDIEMRR
ncbi:hypothetical protein DFA_00925 [Cavenderia fasciculata]|uniref:ComC supersandwich domain-containing protein n=1 Tax=Cavenderia fasciculata TaxID=261658 RepID=F4PUI0_CACFS|nr:uncharacterized protein DFA_00925 [Cavenderia fasciculata]EGG21052.1 hypothetical protein DFA_00925 [Cavenderia fasciculata]|eukprot:XP_004358902.1 hypothetical protein DFA_00925 [Cavenderia fasciculata]